MKRVFILAALLLGLVVGAGPVAAAPAGSNAGRPISIAGSGTIDGFCPFSIDATQVGAFKVIILGDSRTTTIFPAQ
jgi:hypothetical protein